MPALETVDHGRLGVLIAEMPIKCPVTPFEFTFLAEVWLRARRIRHRVSLEYDASQHAVLGDAECADLVGGQASATSRQRRARPRPLPPATP